MQNTKDRSDYRTMSDAELVEEARRELPERVDYRELAWAMSERLKRKFYF